MTPLSSTSAYHGHPAMSRETGSTLDEPNPRSHSLRIASYIRVVDLAKSYNINVEKMKTEIDRITSCKSEVEVSGTTSEGVLIEGKDDSHSMISKVTDDSGSSSEKKLREVVASKGYPKRFSAMNGGFNLCLLVGNLDIVVDKQRVDKSRVRLAEVQVGDETGTISLRARDEQIDALQKVSEDGGAIVLRNSSIELFQGKFLRLAVTKWGKISVYPDHVPSTPEAPTSINTDLNLSIVDLTRVPADMWLKTIPNAPLEATSAHHNQVTSQSVGQHHQKQQQQNYRNKGRGHDRRNVVAQQGYHLSHVNKLPPRQDYRYNQMMGITQGMTSAANSYGYPGTQYYSGYDDTSVHSMHSMHHKQRMEQQKQQISQQQLLFMQQQHYQLQRQMQQMERFLYTQNNVDPSTINQASSDFAGEVHDSDALNRNQMPSDQLDVHQTHLDSHDISDNRSISWSVTGENNMMTMEVPMSPQMNPHATSFAPHYQIPELGSAALMQGQQPYYNMQSQQGPNYLSYDGSAYYQDRRNDSLSSNEHQHNKNG